MAKRVRIGDVMQILSSQGVSYAQVSHKHTQYGFLIRVMPGTYDRKPQEFSAVVDQEPQFSTFFLVQTGINQGLFAIVANVPVAPRNQAFPTFRTTGYGRNGERGSWWLWDGQDEVRLDRLLTDAEKRYPLRGIISAPLLVERIDKGYRAEIDDV
ncbi:hypothetical protein ACG873_20275 [Mesorhizobium sp. AaZ16]|uniref:hypothetical protein n=1 Tax=Mesorhizobium sp. AaZ16 TaxID=3402289 RepID=UPI00374F08FE